MENNFMEGGSENNLFFSNDQCHFGFENMSQFPEVSLDQFHFTPTPEPVMSSPQVGSNSGFHSPEVEEVHRNISVKKQKLKKVSRRGINFSNEEDVIICSAWLNVSTDATVGCNQTQGGFYRRMHAYYMMHKAADCERSQIAIQGRWQTIQKAVNKFCGFKRIVDRRNESGKNEADRIDDAKKMFEDSEPFHFMHCWKILKDEPKWTEKLQQDNVSSKSQGQVPEGNVDSMERPEGRDSAKKKKTKQAESESSTAVEVLQRIHDNREKNQLKEDEQLQQILARKDEKLSLQREILQIKKQSKEKELLLREQEAERKAKQTEAQLLAAEAGIMGIDLEKVAPHLKDYYIGMQKQIMERRGFAPRPANSSG